MYCPQCGQERISDVTSFCSRCGYLLTGTADLMKTGGAAIDVAGSGSISPRRAGVRQGVFMLMLMIIVAPIIGMISVFALGIDPWPVGLTIFLLGGGGLLRIVYALLFESKAPSKPPAEYRVSPELNPRSAFPTAQLPPQQDIPATEYISPQPSRDSDVVTRTPGSVTEGTTRLLDSDSDTKPEL